MTDHRRDCGKILTSLGGDIKFLTKVINKQKIRNCELERLKESALGTVRQPEAVFVNKRSCETHSPPLMRG